MYKEVILYMENKLKSTYPNTYIGETDWEETMKLNKDIVEILPEGGDRNPEGVGNIGTDKWNVDIFVSRKGLAQKSRDLELDAVENMESVVNLFKADSTSVENYLVRFSVIGFNASRVRLSKEKGKGFYATGCSVTVQIKITR